MIKVDSNVRVVRDCQRSHDSVARGSFVPRKSGADIKVRDYVSTADEW
jgi:hypothetical protein